MGSIRLMTSPILKNSAAFLGLLLVLSANAFFLQSNAYRHLDFYNMGSFLDGGWRILTGQKPFVDFMLNVGPVHIYLHALFFYFFGFGKLAILAHLVVISSVAILLTYGVARRRVGIAESLLLTALSATSFYWACSHPWYTHTAHLLGMFAVAFLILYLPFSTMRQAAIGGALCGALSVISFLTKTNVGVAYGALFFVVLCLADKKRVSLGAFFAGALVAALASIPLFVHDPVECFNSILSYSKTQAWRFNYFGKDFWLWFRDFYWLAAAVVGINLFLAKRAEKSLVALFLGLWPLTLFISYTSLSNNNADAPPMALYLLLGLILIQGNKTRFYAASKTILLILTVALTAVYARNGFTLESWKPEPSDYTIQTPALRGWQCLSQHGGPIDAMTTYLNASVPQEDSLLIVTDMQFLYALTNRESLKHVPYGYAINFLPMPGEQREETRRNIMANPPRWIITHLQAGGYAWNSWLRYLDLGGWVLRYYTVEKQFDNYVLLKLR